MIDFPIPDLMDEGACLAWFEHYLHPAGLCCPHCGSTERRVFRPHRWFAAYRCRQCDGYYPLLSGTVFAKSRQAPSTLVVLLRGIAKGEPTARLARELHLDRKHLTDVRQRIQANLFDTLPSDLMEGTTFEADELSVNAGEKSTPHLDPNDPPPRRATKRRGRGTSANDRPPIIGVISRETGECRYWVEAHADRQTTREISEQSLPPNSTLLFTDEATNYHGVHPNHKSVCHRAKEWARDADGDGRGEVHCNTCAGAGAALRTFLRPFRGVHKQYLIDYVATFETLKNAKRITVEGVQRMCYGTRRLHSNPT